MHAIKELTMSRTFTCSLLATLAIVCSLSGAAPAPRPADGALGVRLMKLQEVRRTTLHETEGFGSFGMSAEEGISVEFSFDRIPEGRRVVMIEQPKSIVATDSAGTDLTKIPPSFMDENVREYLEAVQSVDDSDGNGGTSITGVTLHLTSSKRTASTLNVSTSFDVATTAGTEPRDISLTDAWQPMEVNGETFEVHAGKDSFFGGQGIEIRPSSAKKLFASCALVVDGEPVSTAGSIESNGTIMFTIDQEFSTPTTARFMVYTDYKKQPVKIELKGQPLP
jgi:hypothetical protein